jgi:hypothetical protein
MTGDQQKKLEAWLFEENISYVRAVERCLKEFNVKTHPPAIQQFYARCLQHRMMDKIAVSADKAHAINREFNHVPFLESTGQAIAQCVFEETLSQMEGKEPNRKKVEALGGLSKIMVDGRAIRLKSDDQSLQLQKFKLELKRYKKEVIAVAMQGQNQSATLQAIEKMEQMLKLV